MASPHLGMAKPEERMVRGRHGTVACTLILKACCALEVLWHGCHLTFYRLSYYTLQRRRREGEEERKKEEARASALNSNKTTPQNATRAIMALAYYRTVRTH